MTVDVDRIIGRMTDLAAIGMVTGMTMSVLDRTIPQTRKKRKRRGSIYDNMW